MRGDRAQGQNPNPHFIMREFDRQSPNQVVDYLLCEECEQMFRRTGEDWVLDYCYRGPGKFRLYSALGNAQTAFRTDTMSAYYANGIREINADALGYFGASVFWRAAARNWHIQRQLMIATSLGDEYQEQIRQFLLGHSGFPSLAVMIVIVSQDPEPAFVAMFPNAFRHDGYFHHHFHIPGIGFHVFLGRQVPQRFTQLCLFHSPQRMIYSSATMDDLVLQNMAELIAN